MILWQDEVLDFYYRLHRCHSYGRSQYSNRLNYIPIRHSNKHYILSILERSSNKSELRNVMNAH